MQQAESLGLQCFGQNMHPGYTPAWTIIACYQSELDWIAANDKDYRDGRGRDLGRQCRPFAAARNKDGHRPSCKFSRQRWQPVVQTMCPAVFDCHILALDVVIFSQ